MVIVTPASGLAITLNETAVQSHYCRCRRRWRFLPTFEALSRDAVYLLQCLLRRYRLLTIVRPQSFVEKFIRVSTRVGHILQRV